MSSLDPDAALIELRELANELIRGFDCETEQHKAVWFAEKFQELDEWLQAGGYLPMVWESRHGPRRKLVIKYAMEDGEE